jgi:hypothetical protein
MSGRTDTPWYVEVESADGSHSFVLVEVEDDPSECNLLVVDHNDQSNPAMVLGRVIGRMSAKPIDALRLLRAVGYVVLNDEATMKADYSPEDREDYFTDAVTDVELAGS